MRFRLSYSFHGEPFVQKAITKHEHYTQRERIAELFGYRPWAADFLPQLAQQAEQIMRRDVTPGFVAGDQQPVWQAYCECGGCLQFDHALDVA